MSEPSPRPAQGPAEAQSPTAPRKGPLSYLSGALTSLGLAWVCWLFSGRVVAYFLVHPPHYSQPFAQSIGTAIKTLVIGTSFLATFSFAFVGIGLLLVFIRSLTGAGASESS